MKKIISIISILAGITLIYSCREQDDEPIMNAQMESVKLTGQERKVNEDSIKHPRIHKNGLGENGVIETDPPPKNGGQWRTKS